MLYANARAPVAEQTWATLVQSIAGGDQLALHTLYEMAHRIVFPEKPSQPRQFALPSALRTEC
jgi:hypothetical protein